MTHYRKLFLALPFLFFAAHPAQAETVDLTFVNVGPGYNDGSYYDYPYNFSINGSNTLTSLICDDFNDDIWFGESWSAYVNGFADILGGAGQMQPGGGLVASGRRAAAYKDA